MAKKKGQEKKSPGKKGSGKKRKDKKKTAEAMKKKNKDRKGKGKREKKKGKKKANPSNKKIKKSKKKKEKGKKKERTEEIRPVENVDEEIHKLNKKIKRYSKTLGMPKTEYKVEQEISKEMSKAHKLLDAAMKLKFYVATYTVALGVLAYLLGRPESFFWHFIFGWLLLWIAHHFHKNNERYNFSMKFFYIGIMIILLYIFYSQLNDLFSLVMVVLYMICFLVATALYFHHTGKEIQRELHQSFTRTFLVVWYSHVLALAVAVLLAYHLPHLILADSFVSVMYIVLLWFVPVFFVYFYLNKFFYLRFFDPAHIKRDSTKALKHAVAYTAIFTASMVLVYLLTAVHVSIEARDSSLQVIDEKIDRLGTVRGDIIDYAESIYSNEINNLEVTRDIIEYSEQIANSLESKKSTAVQPLGVRDYLTDRYYKALTEKRLGILFLAMNTEGVVETKDDLIRNYKKADQERLNLTKDKGYVEQNYRPYKESESLKEFKDYIYSNRDDYDDLMFNNELFTFTLSHSDITGMNIWAPRNSKFSKKMFFLWSHLKIFRESMYMAFETIIYSGKSITNPEVLDELYYNRDVPESKLSESIRYRILAENWKAVST